MGRKQIQGGKLEAVIRALRQCEVGDTGTEIEGEVFCWPRYSRSGCLTSWKGAETHRVKGGVGVSREKEERTQRLGI